jgi:hypothetical protein
LRFKARQFPEAWTQGAVPIDHAAPYSMDRSKRDFFIPDRHT